jgi:hypothetical protein
VSSWSTITDAWTNLLLLLENARKCKPSKKNTETAKKKTLDLLRRWEELLKMRSRDKKL